LALNLESFGDIRGFSHSLVQHIECLSVLPSDCSDFASVEEIFAKLVIGFSLREGALIDQVIGSLKLTVPQIIPQQKVEDSALTQFVRSDTGSIQGLKKVLSDAFIFVLFLVDTGISVVENCCVGIERSAVGDSEFVEKILDQPQAFVILGIFPENLDLKNAHKTFQFESFGDSGDKIFAHFNFFSEFLAVLLRLLDGGRHLEAQTLIEGVEVVTLDDVPILFDIFGDLGDGSGLLVIEGLVEQSESVLDF
jgi:hypothetical protein